MAAPAGWLAGPAVTPRGFADFDAALSWIDSLSEAAPAPPAGAFTLPQTLHHLAQSIEFSLHGFPEPKPAWFRSSLGPLAFRVFERHGAMRHDTAAVIPGAPALPDGSLAEAAQRLRAAIAAFAAHRGPLQPHFAYGALDHTRYTRAHLMHLADHARLWPV